jgi:hypothetical protein
MSHDEYQAGRKGLGPVQTNDPAAGLDYARGIADRLAADQPGLTGQAHPQAPQLVILILGLAATFAILWKVRILPFEIWQVVLMYGATLFVSIWGLRRLPNWLSGALMAGVLGALAAALGWHLGGIYWAVGAGLVIGALMYRLYSRFD